MTPKPRVLAAGAVIAAVSVAGVVLLPDHKHATDAAADSTPSTAAVERGTLAQRVSTFGTVTYRAQPDGSPYQVIDQARGTYTALRAVGDRVDCGDVLYRVDAQPVVLLCGATPAFRSVAPGAIGPDVAELNANLVHLGYASNSELSPTSGTFSAATAAALTELQTRSGQEPSGSVSLGQVVFLPESLRIAAVSGVLGAAAQRGTPVMTATSSTPEVEVNLDPSDESTVKVGDHAQITLPDHTTISGRVRRVGAITQPAAAKDGNTGSPTIPVSISPDQPAKAAGLDQATVQVRITTGGVRDALNVPVVAIVAMSGDRLAVEVVRSDGQRDMVPVSLGLVDDVSGRVQVDGNIRDGDAVVVPSS